MTRTMSLGLILGFSIAWFGCGSESSTSGTQGGTGGTGGSGTVGTGGSGGGTGGGGTGGLGSGGSTGGGGSGGEASAPEAPVMKSVKPLGGGLHVIWANTTTDCTKIELARKKDAGEYAVAYTLAGAADSQHDGNATAPGMYCYKARCLKGGQTSPDSNEKCGTP